MTKPTYKHFVDSQDNPRVPPGQRLAKKFPVLTFGPTPIINKEDYELEVYGLVQQQCFAWQDLMALAQTELSRDFHCVTRWSKLDVAWKGILTVDFVKALSLEKEASHLMVHCYGGYTTNVSLEDFLADGCLLAHQLEGEDIPAEHGGPMRLIIPHLYAWKSAKWVQGLEFLREEQLGFWERNGYHHRGDPFAEERTS